MPLSLRALTFSILFSLVLQASLPAASAQELLQDSGFESGGFAAWGKDWTPYEAGALITATAAHSGSYGLWEYTDYSSVVSFSGSWQAAAASEGDVFTGSAWVRTTPVAGGGSWLTGGEAFVRAQFMGSGGVLAYYDSAHLTQASSGWQQLTVQTPPAPAGTVSVRLIVRVQKAASASAGQAVANFDDCSLTKAAAPPLLGLSQRVISFGEGGTQANISITNKGAGTLHWQAVESAPWLALSAASGDTTSESDTVMLTADRSGLSLENYHTVVSFTSDGGNLDVDVYLDTPRSYTVPAQPSVVTTDGYQLIVRRRLPNGRLNGALPYIMKGAAWSPAGDQTGVGAVDMRLARQAEFANWYGTDIPMLREMNANTVYVFIDFGLDAQAFQVLDALYKNGMMAVVTVDWDGSNDVDRIQQVVSAYKNHPAVLMWALGNEWNINLFHDKNPDGTFVPGARYYTLRAAAEAAQVSAQLIKSLDANHPVATIFGEIKIAGADPDTATIVNTICTAVDVWGVNIYRGNTFSTLFTEWKDISAKPMFLSEFGADSYRTTTAYPAYPLAGYPDEPMQDAFVAPLAAEIMSQLSAEDPVKVCVGGTVFEWNDEWWKVQPGDGGSLTAQDNGGFYSYWNYYAHPDGCANEEYFGVVRLDRGKKPLFNTLKNAFAYQLNMDVPYRSKQSSPGSSGAAAAEMILDYVRDTLAADLGQSEIYAYGHGYNDTANSTLNELDPRGMACVLGHFDPYDALVSGSWDSYDANPAGNPFQGYNYSVVEVDPSSGSDAFAHYLKEVSKWMAYQVPQMYGQTAPLCLKPNTPSAVPIFGGYRWIVAKGVAASANPCPYTGVNAWYTPDIMVNGFWFSDPEIGGIGQESYKTAAECEQTYFLPIVSSDAYNGKYVVVAEPPKAVDDRTVSTAPLQPARQRLEAISETSGVPLRVKNRAVRRRAERAFKRGGEQTGWRDLVDPVMLNNQEVIAAFEGALRGSALKVRRLDNEAASYILVPYGRYQRRVFKASGTIILDARSGAFREASWTREPSAALRLEAYPAAVAVVNAVAGKNLGQRLRLLSKVMRGVIKPELVWAPGRSPSPYEPWWQVVVNGRTYNVRQNSKVALETK